MRRFIRGFAITVVVSAMVSFITSPALADELIDDPAYIDGATIHALSEFNPGTTDDELREFLVAAAERHGVTPAEFAASSLVEAQASAEASIPLEIPRSVMGRAVVVTAAATSVKLGTAARKGDVFTAPATTLGIAHGHSGIYYTTATVIEAPGLGRVVKKTAASSITVGAGAHKLYVITTQSKRDAAADWAATKLGLNYNPFFADNKNIEDDVYNCSQIVWAAYMKKAAIDLDDNGGSAVYPVDIRDSSKTTSYKTFT